MPEDTAKRYADIISYEDAKKVVGFDWMADHSKNSTSLNVSMKIHSTIKTFICSFTNSGCHFRRCFIQRLYS